MKYHPEYKLLQQEQYQDWCHERGLDPDDDNSDTLYTTWQTRTQDGYFKDPEENV